MALRPLLSFQQAQHAQVFLLKPAPFCSLFACLRSINKSASSLLLCDSCSVLATLSSPPSFLLPQSLWSIRLQWAYAYLFLPGNNAADELARRGAILVPSAIPCCLSPLISRVHSPLFSDWMRTVSSKFFDTQAPSIPTRNLCSLVTPTAFSLSLLQRTQPSVYLLSF